MRWGTTGLGANVMILFTGLKIFEKKIACLVMDTAALLASKTRSSGLSGRTHCSMCQRARRKLMRTFPQANVNRAIVDTLISSQSRWLCHSAPFFFWTLSWAFSTFFRKYVLFQKPLFLKIFGFLIEISPYRHVCVWLKPQLVHCHYYKKKFTMNHRYHVEIVTQNTTRDFLRSFFDNSNSWELSNWVDYSA